MKNKLENASLTLLGVVLVLCLIVSSIPLVSTAILAEFNYDDVPDVFYFFRRALHVLILLFEFLTAF